MSTATNTAPHLARQSTEPAPRRDLIAFALFYRMDFCERHPGVMFLAIGGLVLLERVFEAVFA